MNTGTLSTRYPAARVSLANYRRERPGYANRSARRHRRDLQLITQLATMSMRCEWRVSVTRVASAMSNWSAL